MQLSSLPSCRHPWSASTIRQGAGQMKLLCGACSLCIKCILPRARSPQQVYNTHSSLCSYSGNVSLAKNYLMQQNLKKEREREKINERRKRKMETVLIAHSGHFSCLVLLARSNGVLPLAALFLMLHFLTTKTQLSLLTSFFLFL